MHRTIRLAAAAAFLAVAALPQGQNPNVAAAEHASALAATAKVSVTFPGGTLAELIATIKAREPRTNIVAAFECQEVPMPAVTLTDVTVFDALRAAGCVADQDWVVQVSIEASGAGQPVHTVQVARRAVKFGGPKPEPARAMVFTLKKLTEAWPGDPDNRPVAQKPETILSAIEVGVQGTSMQAPKLRYHAESGLLFVHGDGQQVDLVKQVLSSIEEGQSHQRQALHAASVRNDEIRAREEMKAREAKAKDAGKDPK
jgi:hypothetical protein